MPRTKSINEISRIRNWHCHLTNRVPMFHWSRRQIPIKTFVTKLHFPLNGTMCIRSDIFSWVLCLHNKWGRRSALRHLKFGSGRHTVGKRPATWRGASNIFGGQNGPRIVKFDQSHRPFSWKRGGGIENWFFYRAIKLMDSRFDSLLLSSDYGDVFSGKSEFWENIHPGAQVSAPEDLKSALHFFPAELRISSLSNQMTNKS